MKEIPFSSFYQVYQKGDIHVLDVREQEEYDALHLDGVRLLPLSELADRYQELEKDHPYCVICEAGRRSGGYSHRPPDAPCRRTACCICCTAF